MGKQKWPGLAAEIDAMVEGGYSRGAALAKRAGELGVPVGAVRMSYYRQKGQTQPPNTGGDHKPAQPAESAQLRTRKGVYGDLLEKIKALEAQGMEKAEVMSRLADEYQSTQSGVNSAYYRQTSGIYYSGALLTKAQLQAREELRQSGKVTISASDPVIPAEAGIQARGGGSEAVDSSLVRPGPGGPGFRGPARNDSKPAQERSWPKDFLSLLQISEGLLLELEGAKEEAAGQRELIGRLKAQLKARKEDPEAEALRERFQEFADRARAHLPGLAQAGGHTHGA